MKHNYVPHLMLVEIYNTQAKLEKCLLREHMNKVVDEFTMTFRAFLLNKYYVSFYETNKDMLKKSGNIKMSAQLSSYVECVQSAIANVEDINLCMSMIVYWLNMMAKTLNNVVVIIIRNDIASACQSK